VSTSAPLVRGPAPGTTDQVRAVLAMRAAALRGRRRRHVGVALLTIPALAVVAGAVGPFLPAEGGENVRILLPTLWLGFAATTTIAAATGGGRVLLPPDQRAPFPVSPAADHLGTVLLAPLNVAWLVQALGLVLAASWATGPRPAALAAVQVATLVWIVTVTVAGQAFGELVELVRTVRGGAWALRGLTVAVLVAVALVTATGRLVDALDASPLADVVAGCSRPGSAPGPAGAPSSWRRRS
jgi:hypothetical protein